MTERNVVDWAKVAVMSTIGAAVPVLMGFAAKRQFDREYEDATRVRWTDKNRWEK